MHNASLIQLGSVRSNHRQVQWFDSDPATFKAGLKVHQSSTEKVLSLAKSAGFVAGISLGRNLSNVNKGTAVARKGLGVPVRLALKRSTGLITITNVTNLAAGDTLTVGATGFVGQSGAATPGQATFQATGTTAQTATNLAAQINAHATAKTLVYAIASAATVRLYAVVQGAGVGNDVAVSYTDASPTSVGLTLSELTGGKLAGGSNTASDIAYLTKGAKVYFNDATGEADIAMSGFSTISDAVYCSDVGILSSLEEDGTAGPPATYVDMQGGL